MSKNESMQGGALWGRLFAADTLPLLNVKGPKAFVAN